MGSEVHDIEQGESGTDGAMAERTIKNLHLLDSMADAPLNIIMNNQGGDEYACFAIIDAIRQCRSHVTITAMGHAMSAGSLILQAADKRVMGPLSVQMIHYGTWGCVDHSKTFQKWAREGQRIDQWMEQYYLTKIQEKQPKFTLAKLKQLLDHDTFLTAQESLDLGLCDEILGVADVE
jgi:ATP-dependent protease ClpP protease subunit